MNRSNSSGEDGKAAVREQRYDTTIAGNSRISLGILPAEKWRAIISGQGQMIFNPKDQLETREKRSAADETFCRERTSERDSVRQHRAHHCMIPHKACAVVPRKGQCKSEEGDYWAPEAKVPARSGGFVGDVCSPPPTAKETESRIQDSDQEAGRSPRWTTAEASSRRVGRADRNRGWGGQARSASPRLASPPTRTDDRETT
jgi:hypothetical protein